LDREIDGIAGATLSVAAMERMARLALFFERMSRQYMSARQLLLRLLRRWHARIGFAAMLFFLILAATGLALNHGPDLGFDGRFVHAERLARWGAAKLA